MLLGAAAPAVVRAQAAPEGAGGGIVLPGTAESTDQPSNSGEGASIQTSLGAAGDPFGLRGTLSAEGVTYSIAYIGEVLGNVSGGQRRGAIGEGRLDLQLDIDLGKAIGLAGGSLHTEIFGTHGHGLSQYYLGNLNTVSGIEALSELRLSELWFEQAVADGKAAFRIGQLAADTEFVVSQYGTLFVNGTFGFPAILQSDLPNGGPAYPLATPGIRLKLTPDPSLAVLVGIFNGAPAGRGPGDPQANDHGGLEFRLRDPALIMAEVAYTYGDPQAQGSLPGTVKLGGFAHLGRFDDLRPGPIDGLPLRRYRGNGGLYVVLDQLVLREPGTKDQGLGVFIRAAAAPGDRNLVSAYLDGGLTYKGLIPGRPDDTLGIAGAYTAISSGARGADRIAALANPAEPIRSAEGLVELSYQALIVPGWTVQPDLQYVIRPGGGVINPRSVAGRSEPSALVVGLRTSIRY